MLIDYLGGFLNGSLIAHLRAHMRQIKEVSGRGDLEKHVPHSLLAQSIDLKEEK